VGIRLGSDRSINARRCRIHSHNRGPVAAFREAVFEGVLLVAVSATVGGG